MSRKLLSTSDIATKFNIEIHDVWNWYRRNPNFPKPVQFVNNSKTPLFDKAEIEKFMKQTNRAK